MATPCLHFLPASLADGTVLAALAGCAALVATSTLFAHHVDTSKFQAGAGYAEALRPLIGAPGAGLFALGLIEAGAVAMLTISASTAYTVGEVRGHNFPSIVPGQGRAMRTSDATSCT